MSGGIYLLRGEDDLVEMRQASYDSEDVLQTLLAKHPSLLAGDQLPGTEPRRWLLVRREAGLASEADGGARWSVDHLFVDQDAVPTLVEVKRSEDTRIRREVVGQMLDYAANAVVYWPVETLIAAFERRCEDEGVDPTSELSEVTGPEGDADEFWKRVDVNLHAGRVRLVFISDEIPPELRRVVEFLNGQMDPAEVLAIEVKQYVGQDLKTLVPRVIGQTAQAESRKSPQGDRRQWDEQSFFSVLDEKAGPDAVRGARELLGWAQRQRLRLTWGRGKQDGSCQPVVDTNHGEYYPIGLYTHGKLEIQFMHMNNAPFDALELRRELLSRLNEIPGVSLPDNEQTITGRPRLLLAAIGSDHILRGGLEAALDWFCDVARAGASPAASSGSPQAAVSPPDASLP